MNNLPTMEAQGPRNSLWLRTASLVAAGTAIFGVVSCGGDDDTTLSTDPTTTTVELNAEERAVADKLCGEKGIDNSMSLKNQFELSTVGSTDALLPSFRTVENGQTIDATPEEVADVLMAEICVKPDIAAVFSALWLETTGKGGTGTMRNLDAGIFDTIEDTANLFRNNKPEMLETVENLASIITANGGVVEVDNYNVIIGEAKLVTTVRNDKEEATQLGTKDAITEGLFEGYQLRFNFEDTNLSEEQKQRMKDIAELILMTKDGEIIVKQWIGIDGQTTFEEVVEESENTMPVDTAIAPSDDTTNVDGNNNNVGDNATDNGNTGDNSGDNGGGGGSGGSGDGDCGSGCGTGGDGSQPGTTEVGPTTTTTKPNHTTTTISRTGTTTTSVFIPATTTTVRPTTTSTSIPRPTTTTEAPTTTGVKPPKTDCDPNIDVCTTDGSNSNSESGSNPIRESIAFGIPGAWVFSKIRRRGPINKQDRKVIV